MGTLLWVILGVIIFNFVMVASVYFSAHSQNSSYRDGKMIQIKHFNKLCSFKNKDGEVVEYCYKMQVYSVIQFIILIIIAVGFVIYEYASGSFINYRTVFMAGFYYTMINGVIMVMWAMSGEAKYELEQRKMRKKKKQKTN